MGEAAKRLGVTSNSARRALQQAGVPLVAISSRAYVVDEVDLQAFIERVGGQRSKGRPRKSLKTGEAQA